MSIDDDVATDLWATNLVDARFEPGDKNAVVKDIISTIIRLIARRRPPIDTNTSDVCSRFSRHVVARAT